MKKERAFTRVYYLVADRWALDDLQKQRIKISRFDDVNDPYELYGLRLKNFPDLEQIFRDVYHEKTGLLCFSKDFSSPVMWSHYADKHKGVCFGFDMRGDVPLREVEYVSAPEAIEIPEEAMNDFLEHSGRSPTERMVEWALLLPDRMFTRKHDGWRYEREVRILVRTTDEENGMYFKSIRKEGIFLREVILGVRSTLNPELIRRLLKAFRHEVTISKAELSDDNYEVRKRPICTVKG